MQCFSPPSLDIWFIDLLYSSIALAGARFLVRERTSIFIKKWFHSIPEITN